MAEGLPVGRKRRRTHSGCGLGCACARVLATPRSMCAHMGGQAEWDQRGFACCGLTWPGPSSSDPRAQGLWMSPKCEDRMVSIACPHVLVFTNDMPDLTKLTADRWVLLEVDKDVPRDMTVDRNFVPLTRQQIRQQCEEMAEEAACEMTEEAATN